MSYYHKCPNCGLNLDKIPETAIPVSEPPKPPAESAIRKLPKEEPAPSSSQEALASKFTEIPDTPAPENDRTGIPRALLDLMDGAKILPFEVEAAVAKKHIFPSDMRIRDMPLGYINGVLIGAWAQVRKSIVEDLNRVPF